MKKKDVGMGLLCVVFGTAAIPTSLNIFGKCFSYLCYVRFEVLSTISILLCFQNCARECCGA